MLLLFSLRRTALPLFFVLVSLLGLAHATGSIGSDSEVNDGTTAAMPTLPPEIVQKYYTEEMIQAEGSDPKRCSQRVFDERARRRDTLSVGVEPTVALVWALLIFVLVGVFAAGIAQAFQMVSTIFTNKNK